MREKLQSVFIVALLVIVFASSVTYILAQNSNQPASGYYQLNLVIEKQAPANNSTSGMYSFFVLNNGGLGSSSIIKVPFGKEIKITIINYDPGISTPLSPYADNVSGTVGNTVVSTGVDATGLAQGLQPDLTVSHISGLELSHTFTTDTGLNIPVFPNSTEVAYTYFNTVGNYSWGCMCQCGLEPMELAGSMEGQLVVLPP